MREYLFELRKKANKSQAEIEKELCEKYNCKVHYSMIELGKTWKDLTGLRAEMLADVLETTADHIMQCEHKEGGYVGKHHLLAIDNPHMVRNGRRAEYDAPLTSEEQQLAMQYYPYAEKIIDILRCTEYREFYGNFMSYEDFYDIGMIAFLRKIKALSIKQSEDPDFMMNLENPDRFYRHCFSLAIKGDYSKYIRASCTLRRKDYLKAMERGSVIYGNDENETEVWDLTPNNDLPIPVAAESTCALDMLYRYLNDTQTAACRMLIAGYTIPEIIKNGYASKWDIGIIKFYLKQIVQYGKILWKAKDYTSDAANVCYEFSTNSWAVRVSINAKSYSLGKYRELSIALDLQALLHFHLQKNDFIQWYEAHLRPHPYHSDRTAFVYPLECEESISEWEAAEAAQISGNRRGSKISHSSAEDPKGICYNKKRKYYEVKLGKYRLGTYKIFDEALAIRQAAEEHYQSGDIEIWYADFKSGKEKERLLYTRGDKQSENSIAYVVCKYVSGKYMLCSFGTNESEQIVLETDNIDKACELMELANAHIESENYDMWITDYVKVRN